MEAQTIIMEQQREDSLTGNAFNRWIVTSGASNASLIEDEPFYFAHGGRQTEAFEVGTRSGVFLCFSRSELFKEPGFPDWRNCFWPGLNFERLDLSGITLFFYWPATMCLQPLKTLSRSLVEELTPDFESAVDRSSSASNRENEAEVLPQRGTFFLAHKRQTLFTHAVELRTAELPRWRPHLAIDQRTLNRNNE
jgi:hypothetical protein